MNYCFVVTDCQDNNFELEFRRVDSDAIKQFESVWQRLSIATHKYCELTERSPPSWARWKPWDWYNRCKPGYEPREGYVAWCGGGCVGLMNLWPNFVVGSGHSVQYLEHLFTTPGCIQSDIWGRKYSGIGGAMLAYAISISSERPSGGRIGLHIDNNEAEKFYDAIERRLDSPLFRCLGTDILGPTPHNDSDRGKKYVETELGSAQKLLEVYKT